MGLTDVSNSEARYGDFFSLIRTGGSGPEGGFIFNISSPNNEPRAVRQPRSIEGKNLILETYSLLRRDFSTIFHAVIPPFNFFFLAKINSTRQQQEVSCDIGGQESSEDGSVQ